MQPDDAAHVVRLLGRDREAVMRMAAMPWPVVEAEARKWIAGRSGKAANAFAVLDRESGEFLGSAGFSLGREEQGTEGVAEVGYWIGRPYWGRGCASQAVGMLLGLARRVGAVQAAGLVFPGNAASERVLEKNGFSRIGEEIGDFPLRGGKRTVIRWERVL